MNASIDHTHTSCITMSRSSSCVQGTHDCETLISSSMLSSPGNYYVCPYNTLEGRCSNDLVCESPSNEHRETAFARRAGWPTHAFRAMSPTKTISSSVLSTTNAMCDIEHTSAAVRPVRGKTRKDSPNSRLLPPPPASATPSMDKDKGAEESELRLAELDQRCSRCSDKDAQVTRKCRGPHPSPR